MLTKNLNVCKQNCGDKIGWTNLRNNIVSNNFHSVAAAMTAINKHCSGEAKVKATALNDMK